MYEIPKQIGGNTKNAIAPQASPLMFKQSNHIVRNIEIILTYSVKYHLNKFQLVYQSRSKLSFGLTLILNGMTINK